MITSLKDPEFRTFLDDFSEARPLYALTARTDQLAHGPLDFMESRLKKGDRVVLIPAGLNTTAMPLVHQDNLDDVDTFLRTGVQVEKALLFSAQDKKGYIDEDLIDNPLDLLKRQSLAVSTKDIASVSEVVSAIWKQRNSLGLVSISTHKRELAKLANKSTQEAVVYG